MKQPNRLLNKDFRFKGWRLYTQEIHIRTAEAIYYFAKPLELPRQLKNPDYRFLKIKSGTKKALENWKTKNYAWEELQNYEGNVGIINKFGSLLVIDADSKEISDLVKSKLPPTFTIQSSEKWKNHFIYHCPNTSIKKITFRDSLGDIRGYNGNYYTVIPPSIHPDTKKPYKVINDVPISNITENQVLSVLKQYEKREVPKPKFTSNSESSKHDITKVIDINDFEELHNQQGEFQGVNPYVKSKNGRNLNVNVNSNIFHDWHNEVGGKTIDVIAIKHKLISYEDFVELKKAGKRLSTEIYAEACEIGREKYGFNIPKKNDIVQLYIGKGRQMNVRQVVKHLEHKHTFITVKDATSRKPHIYIYEDGYYKQDGSIVLLKTVKDLYGDNWKMQYENEIERYLKTENVVNRDKIHPPDNLINVKNGIYNIETDKLEPHNSKYYFLYKIPIKYKVDAKMPKITSYFESTLKPEYIRFSQEIFGYCMLFDYPIAGIFYLLGSGGNGKAVWTHLLTNMLGGKDNVASKEIGKLMSNNFASSGLYGKLANICGEMSSSVMRSTDMLKRLSAGDPIDAEFKSRDAFEFPNTAKIITACNEIPECRDTKDGWIQRQYIICFLKKFRGTDKDNTKLKKQLVANKKEMEGLLFWSLQGLKRLLKNERFTYENQEERYYMCQDSISYYLEEHIVKQAHTDYIERESLFEKYEAWCVKNEVPPEKRTVVGRKLKEKGFTSDRIEDENHKWVHIYRYMVEIQKNE